MNLLYLTIGCLVGLVLTTVAFLFGLALCRAAAEQDPESDEYRELIR